MGLIRTNPLDRLSARQALLHPWFKQELGQSNLDSAHLKLNHRKTTKIYEPEQFAQIERVTVS